MVVGVELPAFGELEADDPASDDPEDSELEDFSALTLAELLPESRLSVR